MEAVNMQPLTRPLALFAALFLVACAAQVSHLHQDPGFTASALREGGVGIGNVSAAADDPLDEQKQVVAIAAFEDALRKHRPDLPVESADKVDARYLMHVRIEQDSISREREHIDDYDSSGRFLATTVRPYTTRETVAQVSIVDTRTGAIVWDARVSREDEQYDGLRTSESGPGSISFRRMMDSLGAGIAAHLPDDANRQRVASR
jgi:hypothetical protein